VVVVVDGTVEVVVLVVDATVANPVGAVVQHEATAGNGAVEAVFRTGDPALVVVAEAARLPTDRVAARTADPMRTFINRTDQRGIRLSFPPPASAPVGLRQLSAQTFPIVTHDGMRSRWPECYETVNVARPSSGGSRYAGGPIVPVEVPGMHQALPGAVRRPRGPTGRRADMLVSHRNFTSMSC
jgi:hypothetical protein